MGLLSQFLTWGATQSFDMYYGSQNWSQIYGASGFLSCVNMTCLNQATRVFFAILGQTGWTLLLTGHLYVDIGARKLGTRDVFILGPKSRCVQCLPDWKQLHTTRHSLILEIGFSMGEGGGKITWTRYTREHAACMNIEKGPLESLHNAYSTNYRLTMFFRVDSTWDLHEAALDISCLCSRIWLSECRGSRNAYFRSIISDSSE